MKFSQATVISVKKLLPQVRSLTVSLPELDEPVYPGQFCQLRPVTSGSHDPLLPRPISIADYDPRLKNLTFIIRDVGRGTAALNRLTPGAKLGFLGPLGKGFPLHTLAQGDSALVIGGGLGIPPLYFLAKTLCEQGVKVTSILGFRTAGDLFLTQEFSRCSQVIVTTDDGSAGEPGNVCNQLGLETSPSLQWGQAFACGPLPMLQSLEKALEGDPRPTYISLEKRMACGIGACTACTCKRKEPSDEADWYRLACTDGPVFRLGEVEIDE